jgi:phosphatidylglycerol:prolipoprotein diacylglycerol transferase
MYAIMALFGVFASGIYVTQICGKNGKDTNEGIIFLLIISAGMFFGSHILYAIVNYRILIAVINNIHKINSFPAFLNAAVFIVGGSVFYGGLLGGLLTAKIIVLKKPHYEYLFDIATPAIPLFHCFGRIGCFLGGCCYGLESKFGVTFRRSLAEEANGVNRFPVQLLEALICLLLFLILDYLRKKGFFKSHLIYLYLFFYSVVRFFIEFVRGDEYRGFFFGLSTSQIVSIAIFCVVAPKLCVLLKNRNRRLCITE